MGLKDHATVKLDGNMEIPLIGIDKSASSELCDVCKRPLHLQSVELTDEGFVCDECVMSMGEDNV